MAEIILTGDALEQLRHLPPESVHTCVTSPPYYNLRDYGAAGQIGNEASVEEYLQSLVSVFHEVRRVLRTDGTLWVNMGDSYATRSGSQPPTNTRNSCGHTAKHTPRGYKYKDLIGVPWQLAFALRADGWYLRQDIIWNKSNCMPESVRDRCTKSHEYIFLLSKSERYYFDAAAISEPVTSTKNTRRNCWKWPRITWHKKKSHLRPVLSTRRRWQYRRRKTVRYTYIISGSRTEYKPEKATGPRPRIAPVRVISKVTSSRKGGTHGLRS